MQRIVELCRLPLCQIDAVLVALAQEVIACERFERAQIVAQRELIERVARKVFSKLSVQHCLHCDLRALRERTALRDGQRCVRAQNAPDEKAVEKPCGKREREQVFEFGSHGKPPQNRK